MPSKTIFRGVAILRCFVYFYSSSVIWLQMYRAYKSINGAMKKSRYIYAYFLENNHALMFNTLLNTNINIKILYLNIINVIMTRYSCLLP